MLGIVPLLVARERSASHWKNDCSTGRHHENVRSACVRAACEGPANSVGEQDVEWVRWGAKPT